MEVGSLGVNGAHVLRRVALGHSTAPGAVPGLAQYMVVKSVLGLLDRPGDVILITALLKEAGVFGVNGVRALNHVGLDHSTGQDPVPCLLLHTVENIALGLASKPGTATIAVVL